MILALKVILLSGAYATSKWEGVIEIDSSSLLEDLHLAIQSTLNFDNDHLYEFFIARTQKSRERISFDDENGAFYERTIESLYPLPEKQHLYYLFDYGDYWIFRIAKTKTVKNESRILILCIHGWPLKKVKGPNSIPPWKSDDAHHSVIVQGVSSAALENRCSSFKGKQMQYKGSCHCGKVAFEVEGDVTYAMACNCSICSRKGSLLCVQCHGTSCAYSPQSRTQARTCSTSTSSSTGSVRTAASIRLARVLTRPAMKWPRSISGASRTSICHPFQ